MNRGLIAVVVAAVVAVILLQSSYYIVNPSSWALVLQLGRPVRLVPNPTAPGSGAGIYFKLPFVENVVYLDKRVLNFDAPSEEVPTVDQNQVIVSAYARFEIIDPLLFFQTVASEDGVQARLRPIISSNLRRALGDASMATILTSHRAQLMQQITRQVDNEAHRFGIRVIDVRMKRVDLTLDNSEAIYKQMQTERQQVAINLRAEGQKNAVELRAEADKLQVITIADAHRQASILRGQGDAQATSIYSAAYGRDPTFFDFYRSLQAMTTGLSGDNTTFVGPPDGDFFRYFLKGTAPSSVPGQAVSPQALPVPAGTTP
jgi:membrane protease subunit HflC